MSPAIQVAIPSGKRMLRVSFLSLKARRSQGKQREPRSLEGGYPHPSFLRRIPFQELLAGLGHLHAFGHGKALDALTVRFCGYTLRDRSWHVGWTHCSPMFFAARSSGGKADSHSAFHFFPAERPVPGARYCVPLPGSGVITLVFPGRSRACRRRRRFQRWCNFG